MRIGIIDSGINCTALKNQIQQKNFTNCPNHYTGDINGPGTMVAKTIENFSEREIEIISARIFDQTLAANTKTLISALEFLDTFDLSVIHMSLSVSTNIIHDQLRNICNKLLKKGIKIVTSYSNKFNTTALEQVNGVIVVRGQFFRNSSFYRFNDKLMQGIADNSPMLVQCGDKWYRFFDGNSKAAALFTSHLIHCYNDNTQKFDMELLKYHADKKIQEINTSLKRESDIQNSKELDEKFYCNANKVDNALTEVFKIQDKSILYKQDWLSAPLLLNAMKAIRIIHLLEDIFLCKFDLKHIYLEDFYNYEMFKQFVKRNLI